MILETFSSLSDFVEVVEPYLLAREAEHSFMLGLALSLRARPDLCPNPYLGVVRGGRDVRLVALRTPPTHLTLSLTDDPAAADLVVADLLRHQPRMSGVAGPVEVVRRFTAAWETGGGSESRLDLRARIYRLERVWPSLRAVPGRCRPATRDDAPLIAGWLAAFHAEAIPNQPHGDATALVERWLGDDSRIVYLWESDGRPVSMAVAGARTPNGVRIGSVYTPPAERRRGFGTALIASASQDQLDRGRRFCFLDADLANPTSNAVYEAVGYRPVGDIEIHRFAGDE